MLTRAFRRLSGAFSVDRTRSGSLTGPPSIESPDSRFGTREEREAYYARLAAIQRQRARLTECFGELRQALLMEDSMLPRRPSSGSRESRSPTTQPERPRSEGRSSIEIPKRREPVFQTSGGDADSVSEEGESAKRDAGCLSHVRERRNYGMPKRYELGVLRDAQRPAPTCLREGMADGPRDLLPRTAHASSRLAPNRPTLPLISVCNHDCSTVDEESLFASASHRATDI